MSSIPYFQTSALVAISSWISRLPQEGLKSIVKLARHQRLPSGPDDYLRSFVHESLAPEVVRLGDSLFPRLNTIDLDEPDEYKRIEYSKRQFGFGYEMES